MRKLVYILLAVSVLTGLAFAYGDDEVTTMPVDPDDPDHPDQDSPENPGEDADERIGSGIVDLPGQASDTATQATQTISETLANGADTITGLGDTISGLLGQGDDGESGGETQEE